MNRKLLLSSFLLLFQTEIFYAETPTKFDKSEMSRIVLWEGEITGIYKDKGADRKSVV